MISVNSTDARNQFGELLDRAKHNRERIQIEQDGQPIAAIISCEDLARLEALEDAIDSALLKQAMERSEGFMTIDQLLAIRPIQE